MVADIFTNSLTGSLFFEHAATLNGKRIRSSVEFAKDTKRSKSQRQSRCNDRYVRESKARELTS
jgi:hypothetical protein